MKTNFNITVGSMAIEVQGQVVNTPEVVIKSELEFTLGEAKGMYDLQKQAIKEMPELIKDFAIKFATILKEVDDHSCELYKDRMPKETAEEFLAGINKGE